MVRLTGADAVLQGLRKLEPETAKEVAKDIKKAGDGMAAYIRQNAPSASPMRGWRDELPARPRGTARGWPAWAPIGASVSRRKTSVVVTSTGASAAIYESAGAVNPGGRTNPHPPGELFVNILQGDKRLVQSGKKKGRLARAAVKELYPQTLADIQKACDRAVDAINRRMP